MGAREEALKQLHDDVRDDECIAYITVKIARSGAMAVSGAVGDEMFALACLDQAKQSVKDFHKRRRGESTIIAPQLVPAYDTPLAR